MRLLGVHANGRVFAMRYRRPVKRERERKVSETRVFKSRGGKALAKGMADTYFLIREAMPLTQQHRQSELFNTLKALKFPSPSPYPSPPPPRPPAGPAPVGCRTDFLRPTVPIPC